MKKKKPREEPASRILVMDIGNTSVTLGVYHREKVSKIRSVPGKSLSSAAKVEALQQLAGKPGVDGVAISSVVPLVDDAWAKAIRRAVKRDPLFVTYRLNLGIPITFPRPAQIGADRLAASRGAFHRYGAPVIVADFGTALTFDVVTRDEGYIGGVITAGLPLMFDYLSEKTAKLPHIKPGKISGSIGKSTREAMRIGAQVGYVGMVKEILGRIKRDLGSPRIPVVATGGYAGWVVNELKVNIPVERDLLLYGLGRIYELNKPD